MSSIFTLRTQFARDRRCGTWSWRSRISAVLPAPNATATGPSCAPMCFGAPRQLIITQPRLRPFHDSFRRESNPAQVRVVLSLLLAGHRERHPRSVARNNRPRTLLNNEVGRAVASGAGFFSLGCHRTRVQWVAIDHGPPIRTTHPLAPFNRPIGVHGRGGEPCL